MIKRIGKYSFVFFCTIVAGAFLNFKEARAASTDVVLNEVMVDPSCPYDKCEWLELYNNNTSDAINLKNWTINDKEIVNDVFIEAQDYLVITKNLTEFNKVYKVDVTKIIQLDISLSNTGKTLTLKDESGNYEENFTYLKAAGTDISWEKIDPLKESDDNWHEALVSGGTPATKNSVTGVFPPQSPTLLSPFFGQKFIGSTSIQFQWQDGEPNLIFEFILSQNVDLSSPLIDENDLNTTNYQADDLSWGSFYWRVIASNGLYETASTTSFFTISGPSYCDAIIISELLPNPSGDQTGEWIELYNDSTDEVNLKNWTLEDLAGNTHQFIIGNDLVIPPKGYIVIFRSQSGITLNDESDGVTLYQPNGHLLYQTPLFYGAKNDISWARAPDNTWSFTSTPAPAAQNKITVPVVETTSNTTSSSETQTNTIPIEIATGDFKNYKNQLVKISGEVVDTSGNTFYLDDGSGEVKIYIQNKTGIDKPAMHRGDIFEIIGIVDLYGIDNWRILPQKQDDIKLVRLATKTTLSSTAKSSTKKTATASTTTASSSPTKKVLASNITNQGNSNTKENAKTPFWLQLTESLVGLSVIAFALFIMFLRKRPRENIIGGHFGDDMT